MFLIKRIADPRLAGRVCGSFGITDPGAFAYGAFQDDTVLATAAFLTAPGGCVTFCDVDAGRRRDIGLIDGLARAAFAAQRKAGAKTAKLGPAIPKDIRVALTKLGYDAENEFDLAVFFSQKRCGK